MAPKRHFPNWIDAYQEYAQDGFCPDSFHLWTGLSILSGVLERKVFLQNGPIRTFPNTFILLVSNPGVGKSTAIRRGTELIEKLKAFDPKFKVMSGLVSQAGMITELREFKLVQFHSAGLGTPMTSCYYYASEASDSGLQNLAGDFNATITALYDCDDQYSKKLKHENYTFPNPSFCTLAGSTFDFLKTLVNQNSVMGGLASRFLYVVSKEKRKTVSLWGQSRPKNYEMRNKLFEDLVQIYNLVGQFRIETRAMDLFDEWNAAFGERFHGIESERLQSIMTRVPTSLCKVLMLCSVSERNDLSITHEHMKRAIELTEAVTKDNPTILSQAIMGNKNSPDAIFQFIGQTLKQSANCAGLDMRTLKSKYLYQGYDPMRFESTVEMMTKAGMIEQKMDGIVMRVLLHFDPDKML